MSDVYELTLWITGFVCLGFALAAYRLYGDLLHPAIYLGGLLLYPYFISPMILLSEGVVERYLPIQALPEVQILYLVGIVCFLTGAILRPMRYRWGSTASQLSPNSIPVDPAQLKRCGLICGAIGLASWTYSLTLGGGFGEVYGVSHARLNQGSGYIRDLKDLLIVGLLLTFASGLKSKFTGSIVAAVVIFSLPILSHAVLGSSRGSTYLLLVSIFFVFYLVGNKRPNFLLTLLGGWTLVAVIFFLVSNREVLYFGSDLVFKQDAIYSFIAKDTGGHEYIYGSAGVMTVTTEASYQWGALYVIRYFIKPIPSQIWPSKYEDATDFFGVPSVREAMTYFPSMFSWAAPDGAAMGLIPDLWIQFWVLTFLILYLLGRAFSWLWGRSVSNPSSIFPIYYALVSGNAIFLCLQDFDAFLNKLLYAGLVGFLVWMTLAKVRLRSSTRGF